MNAVKNPTLAALRALLAAPQVCSRVVAAPSCSRAPKAPAVKKSATSRAVSREIEIKARRSPGNVAQHVRVPYCGPAPTTPAAAAKLRREAMLMCPCRLCALALYPPQTFEEARWCGFAGTSVADVRKLQDKITKAFAAPRPFTEAQATACAELDAGPEWAEGEFQ